jgi:RND superfamily putative drug exporter
MFPRFGPDEVDGMAGSLVLTRVSDRLTSRRGARAALGGAVVVLVALFGLFGDAESPARSGVAPADSESVQVDELMREFPHADRQSVLVVASRAGGAALSSHDVSGLEALIPKLDSYSDAPSSGPMVSEDGRAAVIVTPVKVDDGSSGAVDVVKALRGEVTAHAPDGLDLQVTGGPAFGVDVASAFDGADVTLLLVTILIVAILLVVTYRSPILWLIPLAVVALADTLAGSITAAAGQAWDLQFDAGIVSVLVFGAGTNYALLLISRYREELLASDDHRRALSAAWRKTVPAVLASNVTVVLALLTLLLAAIPVTRGLGIPAAIGLLIALVVVLLVLPPLLAVCGRRVFWPLIPRPGHGREQGRVWRSVASRVVARPLVSLLAGLAVLGVMASGLFGASLGLDQVEKFRVQSESATGLEVLSEHFPAGEAQPIIVISKSTAAKQVIKATNEVDGVVRAQPAGSTPDGTWTKILVTSTYAPSSDDSLDQITELRDAVHAVPDADALVGGAVATDLDATNGNADDLLLVAPLVLAVSIMVLSVLLHSVIAPVLLLAVNLASAVAAIGAGSWLSRTLFDQDGLDVQVSVLAFLFLVALGIDYTIFLVDRAKTEAARHGTRAGMVEAVTHTGSVITSAGIVLAAVFAALGVLPLTTLGQLGVIVGLGVIVDTIVVRTIIVPAIFSLVGDRIWWPTRPSAPRACSEAERTARPPATSGMIKV